jgi:beta-lactamase class A
VPRIGQGDRTEVVESERRALTVDEQIASLFDDAGCTAQLCVSTLRGDAEICIDGRDAVVAASVIKLLIALELEIQFAEHRLDPSEPCTITEQRRAPGSVGISLYSDDVTASLRDLVVAMMTISDNAASDAVLHTVGIAAVNTRAAELGLGGTIVVSDLATMIEALAVDTGFASYAAMTDWIGCDHAPDEIRAVEVRIASSRALTPTSTTRTTPRDMAELLRLIWTDRAGPPEACRRIRTLMGRQLTRNRIASGFPHRVRVAAKSGGLMGVVRNEVGVIELPDGDAYVAAIFTSASGPDADDAEINRAIGAAAAAAVATLRGAADSASRSKV